MLCIFDGLQMHPHVLVEVVFAREGLATHVTRVGALSGVDPAMPGQLLVADKRLAAAWILTHERPLPCNTTTRNTGTDSSLRVWIKSLTVSVHELECVM